METGIDVEVVSQFRISFKPVLIVCLKPVDLSISVGKISDSSLNLIIVLQRRDLIVFV